MKDETHETEKDPEIRPDHRRQETTGVRHDTQPHQDTAAATTNQDDPIRITGQGTAIHVKEADPRVLPSRHLDVRHRTDHQPENLLTVKDLLDSTAIASRRDVTQESLVNRRNVLQELPKIHKPNERNCSPNGARTIVRHPIKSLRNFKKWQTTRSKFRGFAHRYKKLLFLFKYSLIIFFPFFTAS